MLPDNTEINHIIVDENKLAWHSKSNSALQTFFSDALQLAKAVSAPPELIQALEDYVNSLSHALDGTDYDDKENINHD